jgi:DNA-binding PadR family transcriptional regulator
MTENDNSEKIEDIADSFEVAMKKGFMSALILLVLEEEPCHGYKIQREIERRTFGYFHPTSSTIYPLLDSLREKRLIECIEKDESGRQKKVYETTLKGKETLRMLFQKHQTMIESIKSIILSTLGIIDEKDPSFIMDIESIFSYPGVELIIEKSIKSKIEALKYNKELLRQRIKIMKNNLEMIDNILLRLEKEGENKHVEQQSKEIISH